MIINQLINFDSILYKQISTSEDFKLGVCLYCKYTLTMNKRYYRLFHSNMPWGFYCLVDNTENPP